jgi:hypothetical protein
LPPWPWSPPISISADRSVHSPIPIGDGNIKDVVETVYLRPDVRTAVTSLTQSFTELLSRNETAARQFNELVGGATAPPAPGSERIAPLLAYGLIVLAGGVLGYLSRK